MNIDFELAEESNKETCKGLFFRGVVNKHWFGDKYRITKELRLLKRKSCRSCEYCGYLTDELNQDVIVIEPEVEHGALYELKVTNVSRDWESGIVDDWSLEFVLIKGDNNE